MTCRLCLLFLSLLLLTRFVNDASAAPISLFFTQEEVQTIDKEIKNEPLYMKTQAKHLLHLGSILYFGNDSWTLWLQGEKWTPETKNPNIHVLHVNADSVQLSVTLQNGRTLDNVALRPHQSLNLLTGKIIEGY